VQVLPAPVRAARLVRNGQCCESNHDGWVASINMRDYQRFPDMPEMFAVNAPGRAR